MYFFGCILFVLFRFTSVSNQLFCFISILELSSFHFFSRFTGYSCFVIVWIFFCFWLIKCSY